MLRVLIGININCNLYVTALIRSYKLYNKIGQSWGGINTITTIHQTGEQAETTGLLLPVYIRQCGGRDQQRRGRRQPGDSHRKDYARNVSLADVFIFLVLSRGAGAGLVHTKSQVQYLTAESLWHSLIRTSYIVTRLLPLEMRTTKTKYNKFLNES